MISSAPAVGESVPPAIGSFDLGHAPAHRRIVGQALVQALVDEGPHPFGVLRPPFRREFAGRLQALAVVENLGPELVEALSRSGPRR